MKNQLMIVLVGLFFAGGQAQEIKQANVIYDSLMIHQYSETRWMKGNRVLKKKELFALLRSNPVSAATLKTARRNRTTARTMGVASMGMLFASIFFAATSPEVGLGLLGGSVAVSLSSIPFYIKGDRTLHESIWLYNRSVVTGDSLKERPPVIK